MNRKSRQILTSAKTKKEVRNLLDELFETCYIDPMTGKFHCKKCNNSVYVDVSRKLVYCPIHGLLI